MLVIGLTGGIGSGKTTVANLFAELDVPIIDTDVIAREVTQPGQPALAEIEKHFGADILQADGTLNRAKLREIIFNHVNERHWLENLLHPRIRKNMEAQIHALSSPYCIAVIPLLLEVEFYSMVNRILVVDASQQAQIERVMQRDKVPHSQVESILKNQASRQDRVARAHDVITNDGRIEDLKAQVDALNKKYLDLASKST